MKTPASVVAGLVLLMFFASCTQRPQRHSLVNFQHLDHLTDSVAVEGKQVMIVHIYSNYPDYRWLDAKESGPEGIACVDDAARAAVLYLRDFELNGRKESLTRARGLLDFVMAMQAPDGEFWNFIHADHSINRDGKTSFKSFGWWAARGIWALGVGARVYRRVDTAYATLMGTAVQRSLPHVRDLLKNYGKTAVEAGLVTPKWLFYESGADATSELLLGLIDYYQVAPTPELRDMISKLAEGVRIMQAGDMATPPYGLHRSWGTLWHLWGNSQTQVLAVAGRVLQDSVMISSARLEADGFYSRLVVTGLKREMDLAKPDSAQEYDQIAYGIRPMTVGLLRLYDATGNKNYLRLAGLAASWFFGNNHAGAVMYDAATGRGYDGLRSSTEINKNSGAESTIEALMTLVELEAYPEAVKYLRFVRSKSDTLSAEFLSPEGEHMTLTIDPAGKTFRCE
jgi:hypothetical protein